MIKSPSFKAFIILTILPLAILLTFFGFDPYAGSTTDSLISNGVVLLTFIGVPLLVRSYFKSKWQPITNKLFLTTIVGITVIVIPASGLLRSMAMRSGTEYRSCVSTGGQSAYTLETCRRYSAVYPGLGLYYQAHLSPLVPTFVMLYTIACVAIIGRRTS